jgi:hypothetical protein
LQANNSRSIAPEAVPAGINRWMHGAL